MKNSWFIFTIGLVLMALSVVIGVKVPIFPSNGYLLIVPILVSIIFAVWELRNRHFDRYALGESTLAPTWLRVVIGLVAIFGLCYWFNQITHDAPMFRLKSEYGTPILDTLFFPVASAAAFLYCFYYSLKPTANRHPRSHVSVG